MSNTHYNGSKEHLENLANARKKAFVRDTKCEICGNMFPKSGMKNHIKSCSNRKPCPVCNKMFTGKSVTCSHGCSNTYFRSGPDHPNWNPESYRTTCFLHHKKKCIICGEEKIIEVHHLDENRLNNSPENLIPLCPTHHQYWHSSYKHEVEGKIYEYISEWKINRDDEVGSSASLGV